MKTDSIKDITTYWKRAPYWKRKSRGDVLVFVEADDHAELAEAGLHALAHHEAVARLEHVQRARHVREGHRADEDRHLLPRAATAAAKKTQI